jgi:hypothetical protein
MRSRTPLPADLSRRQPARRLACALLLAALGLLALVPALAQAAEKGGKQLSVSVFSEEHNSLCVEPKDGAIFANPGLPLNFAPLEAGNSQSAPFPETGAACAEPQLTHPITEGGQPGGEGFKYQNRALYQSRIAGATWVTVYAGARSGQHDPAYYIYNAEFNMKCTKEAVLNGEFAADNAAGVFLNGHWIGQDAMAETSANFTPKTFQDIGKYFLAGTNILQFIVYDTSQPYAGLDFAATTKYGPCKGIKWKNVGTEKEQTQSSGTLTFHTAIGPVTCKKADAGDIWNPTGGNGRDDTVLFDLYECSAGECPKGVTVTASGLPWQSELIEEGGVVRDRSKGVGFTIDCEGREFAYNGEVTPKFVSAAGKSWGYDEFGEGSGSLASDAGGAPLTISGKDSMAGFLNLEPITTTNTTIKPSKEEVAAEKTLTKERAVAAKFEAANGKRIEAEEAQKEEEEQKG